MEGTYRGGSGAQNSITTKTHYSYHSGVNDEFMKKILIYGFPGHITGVIYIDKNMKYIYIYRNIKRTRQLKQKKSIKSFTNKNSAPTPLHTGNENAQIFFAGMQNRQRFMK